MDCSLPGSPVHGILQARILEWVAISFSNTLNYLISHQCYEVETTAIPTVQKGKIGRAVKYLPRSHSSLWQSLNNNLSILGPKPTFLTTITYVLWFPLPIIETTGLQTKHLLSNFNFSEHKWESGMHKKVPWEDKRDDAKFKGKFFWQTHSTLFHQIQF